MLTRRVELATPHVPDARETERAQWSLTSMNANAMNPATVDEMPIDFVRTHVVVHVLGFNTCYGSQRAYNTRRDEIERHFDRDMARAINACNTKGDSF